MRCLALQVLYSYIYRPRGSLQYNRPHYTHPTFPTLTHVRSLCVTRTNGSRTPFGLVAAAQLFSWRASPPGFESSVLLLKDTRRGRRSPQPHSPSGPMGFQWSALCTSPIMANLPTTLLAIGVSTCPNCECTSEESCIACHQCVSYTIRECAHQQSPLHVDSRCA